MEITEHQKPIKRGDCEQGIRPCPWFSCRWHLCWELTRYKKAIIQCEDLPDHILDEILALPETCILDVAREARTDRQIAEILKVSHQAIAQASNRGLAKLRLKKIISRQDACSPIIDPPWRWGGENTINCKCVDKGAWPKERNN